MIKLTVPDIGVEELTAIKEVLDSKYLVQGDKVELFEKQIQDYLGVKHAIAVSSGTAALHLSLLALDIGEGDEVIVPDFTFPATSNVVEAVGASVKMVDIELESLCIDINKIEENITPKTKVIMPVQEFGQSSNMDKILGLAKKYNLKVVEDAACALGAEYKGKKVGTIGDLGCFSLHPRKAITTGEGGIVVTNSDELANKIKMLRNHGMCYEEGKIQFKMAGLNYRMTNIQGAMAIVQMKKLRHINEKRQQLAQIYSEKLRDVEGITIPIEMQYAKHVWQTYHILLNSCLDRNKIIVELKKRGIETNIGAYAVHLQMYYKEKYNNEDNYYPNAIVAYNNGLALPLYSSMTIDEINQVVIQLKDIVQQHTRYEIK